MDRGPDQSEPREVVLEYARPRLGEERKDIELLFATRIVRMGAYGAVATILALYLAALGFSAAQIGWLLTLTLVGDTAISLWLTVVADRVGRRKILYLSAMLMVVAGVCFVMSSNWVVLLVAATVGVISPSGKEIGPFLSIEQAALSQLISSERRTTVFAWYNLVGSMAAALGALGAGWLIGFNSIKDADAIGRYRGVLVAYTVAGMLLATMFVMMSKRVEVERAEAKQAGSFLGLHQSRGIVAKLSGLFALDAFGGGFVMDSILALWFWLKFGLSATHLGTLFFFSNLLAGFSGLVAARLAKRFGLINTMVFTHLPSNVLLMLVPFMPNAWSAMGVLLARFAISQMDVPTRQSYTMAVVGPAERSAAAGITGVARNLGAAIAPVLALPLVASAGLMGWPFFIGGGVKIVYDVMLYRAFSKVKSEN